MRAKKRRSFDTPFGPEAKIFIQGIRSEGNTNFELHRLLLRTSNADERSSSIALAKSSKHEKAARRYSRLPPSSPVALTTNASLHADHLSALGTARARIAST